MPHGLRPQHLRVDGGGEFIADYYRNNSKNTVIIQQFSSPNTPGQIGFSKRDGRTIMDVARCMLNGAALPKSLWGKIAATTAFLPDRPPSKTIGGDTSYYRMFGKHADLFFRRTFETRLHGGCQAHLGLT